MRSNDNFNIITGEVKRQYPPNSHNRRFASLEVIRQLKQTQFATIRDEIPDANSRKLGISRDHTHFQYSYLPKNHSHAPTQPPNRSSQIDQFAESRAPDTNSLINASRAGYNILSHGVNFLADANWKQTKKKNPVSKIRDLGHMHAPNYREKYLQGSNFGKKTSLCNNICEIQRSYGTQKFFRNFK